MRKESLLLPALLFLTAALWPQQKRSVSLGLFGEGNTYTRDTGEGPIPIMGGALADFGFSDRIAAGLRAGYGSERYDVSVFEAMAFGRYYFINTPIKKPIFIQLGGGLALLMEGARKVPAPLGDVAIGVRFPLKKFYIEPYLRGGWPTGMGLGVTIGYRFELKKRPLQFFDKPDVEKTPDGVVYLPDIIFRANNADFIGRNVDPQRGLDEQTIANNMAALREVAEFLKSYPDYTVLVEGHANPVLGTQREHDELLVPLSRLRAEFVRDELVKLGVESGRITTAGMGGSAAEDSGMRNRRVRFHLSASGQKVTGR